MTPQPKYRQIIADLEEKIHTGVLKPGHKIPSSANLCDQYKVSATVINQAVLVLVANGYIDGSPGVGRFVTDKARWKKV